MNKGIDSFGDYWSDGVRFGNIFDDTTDTIQNRIKTYLIEEGIDITRTNPHFHYLYHVALAS